MVLTRVDLPAPLSPTRAVTWPGITVKSTSCRTWTTPKLLLTPRSARRGVALITSQFVTGGSDRADGVVLRNLAGGPRHGDQEIPAVSHMSAYLPVHRSSALTPPSSTTEPTLSLSMAMGSSRIDGTSRPPVESSVVPLVSAFSPLTKAMAASASPLASALADL